MMSEVHLGTVGSDRTDGDPRARIASKQLQLQVEDRQVWIQFAHVIAVYELERMCTQTILACCNS